MGSVPVRVGDADASVDGSDSALSSIEESSVWAEAASIGIKLTSGASNARDTVGECALWANALTESIVPDSSVVA